jgi:hypothetical protein
VAPAQTKSPATTRANTTTAHTVARSARLLVQASSGQQVAQIRQYGWVGLRRWYPKNEGEDNGDEASAGDPLLAWTGEEVTFQEWKARARSDVWHESREAVAVWRSFSSLQGQRLLLPLWSFGRVKALTTGNDQVVASIRRHPLRPVVEMESDLLGNQRCWLRRDRRSRTVTLADQSTGDSVLTARGRHFNLSANTTVCLPDGRLLTFPVRGTRRREAVMWARDSATGQILVHFRLVNASSKGRWRFVCEAVLAPQQPLTREMVWVVHRAPALLKTYFSRPGGG